MIFDISYWTRVVKNFIYVIFISIGLYIGLKLSIFYMPFLVAFIISLMIEPSIKLIMKKTKLTRRTSSIIIFFIVSITLIGIITWLIITIFSEASNLLQKLNYYFDIAYTHFQTIISSMNFNKIHVSNELLGIIQNSTGDILQTISNWIRNSLTMIINLLTGLPNILICIGITFVALYFICVDKIYILDQIEHHFPKLWVKKITKHLKDLTQTLGGYLKAEISLVLISFVISLIGLYILKFIGFNIVYPLLIAIAIGFVDALPILRFRNSYDSMGSFIIY